MKVLLVEPEKTAREADIGNSLADIQAVVGGYIEAVYPFREPVAIVCNEEGKLHGLSLNRALRDESGNVYDIVAGTFFVCGLDEDNFTSLSPEHMERFVQEFKDPELFLRVGGRILAVKATEQEIQGSDPARGRHIPDR